MPEVSSEIQNKRFRRIKFMNENTDIIVQLLAELRAVCEESLSFGMLNHQSFSKGHKIEKALAQNKRRGKRERNCIVTFSLHQK